MPDVVLMQPRFLGKVLTTLSAGKGAGSGAGLMHLAVPPQRSSLPKGLAQSGQGNVGWAAVGATGVEGLAAGPWLR